MCKRLLVGVWLVSWLSAMGSVWAVESPSETKRVRPAAVAGSWYPGEAFELTAYLKQQLNEATPPKVSGVVRALLVPHAGFAYSGPTAAKGFKLVAGRTFKRVVVMGPAHHGVFSGLMVPDATHFETPLGEIPLEAAAINHLLHERVANLIPDVDRREHSIEAQLPWLQTVLMPGWQLVPVLVGNLDQAGYARAAHALRPLLNEETLLVISGDFTHYGTRFGYLPFPPEAGIEEKIKQLDLGAWEQIVKQDAPGFIKYQKQTGITACAFGPLAIFTHLLTPETTTLLVDYVTSGPVTAQNVHSVSYLAGAFMAPLPLANEPTQSALTQEEMKLLVEMAKRATRLAVVKGAQAVSPAAIAAEFILPQSLKQSRGAFVTLKRGEDLRGCIGYIEPIKPLYEAVVENAVNAALRDHRFRPITPAEIEGLELEVSVLSPVKPIDSYQGFIVGEHGVTLSKSGHRAVFLPNVATEQGWNREQTLTQLALKAGLPGDAWRENARFEVFTAQKQVDLFSPIKKGDR